MIRLYLWFCRVHFFLHADHGCERAPGLPCALLFKGREELSLKTSGASRRENAKACRESIHVGHRHCEERLRRSNPESFPRPWIASLALAMTVMGMCASWLIAVLCLWFEKL
jgi:hypothetical protein